jgi:lysophospholipase L1-like esterase
MLARALAALALAVTTLGGCTGPQAAGDSAAAPSRSTVTYFALGDSFTIGTGSSPSESFPARLVADWGCPMDLVNAGVNGFTTEDVINVELPLLDARPMSFATLLVGANDIVRGETETLYRTHLQTIFRSLAKAGVARVVVVPQPDWSRSPAALAFGAQASLHAQIVSFNQILAEEAAAARRDFVDLFPLMESEAVAGMLASDGLHPSAAAYAAWARALSRVVASPCGGARR